MEYRIDIAAEPKKVRGKMLFPWKVVSIDALGNETVIGKGYSDRLDQTIVDAGNLLLGMKDKSIQTASNPGGASA